ncbi:MAG: substrate-binding domain-containing protein [Acidimicrobiia bacterium]|nr:substrate-binding domain-containing protein [Acidimicrobiia bacterium]
MYRSDAIAVGERAEAVPIDPEVNAGTRYPVAVIAGTPHPRLAASFVDHLLGDEARRTFRELGFDDP